MILKRGVKKTKTKLKACIIYLAKQDFTVSQTVVRRNHKGCVCTHEKFCFLKAKKKKIFAQKG